MGVPFFMQKPQQRRGSVLRLLLVERNTIYEKFFIKFSLIFPGLHVVQGYKHQILKREQLY